MLRLARYAQAGQGQRMIGCGKDRSDCRLAGVVRHSTPGRQKYARIGKSKDSIDTAGRTVPLRRGTAPIPLKTVLAVRGRTSGTDGLLPYDLLQKH